MSDQMKWFKLWTSAPDDPDIRALEPALRWAWIAAACYTACHGKSGVLKLPLNGLAALAGYMGVDPASVTLTLRKLPNLRVEIVTRNVTVTWNNWKRFQQDTTAAERMRRYRERRGEENTTANHEKRGPSPPPSHAGPPSSNTEMPSGLTSGEFAEERERRYQDSINRRTTP